MVERNHLRQLNSHLHLRCSAVVAEGAASVAEEEDEAAFHAAAVEVDVEVDSVVVVGLAVETEGRQEDRQEVVVSVSVVDKIVGVHLAETLEAVVVAASISEK